MAKPPVYGFNDKVTAERLKRKSTELPSRFTGQLVLPQHIPNDTPSYIAIVHSDGITAISGSEEDATPGTGLIKRQRRNRVTGKMETIDDEFVSCYNKGAAIAGPTSSDVVRVQVEKDAWGDLWVERIGGNLKAWHTYNGTTISDLVYPNSETVIWDDTDEIGSPAELGFSYDNTTGIATFSQAGTYLFAYEIEGAYFNSGSGDDEVIFGNILGRINSTTKSLTHVMVDGKTSGDNAESTVAHTEMVAAVEAMDTFRVLVSIPAIFNGVAGMSFMPRNLRISPVN